MEIKALVKRFLIEKENRKYLRQLRKANVTYADWVTGLELSETEPDACRPSDQPSNVPDFVVIRASEGILHREAINIIQRYFINNQEKQLLYVDEDVWSGCSRGTEEPKERRLPWFKPDWSPNLLDSCLYFGSILALRRELFQRVNQEFTVQAATCSGREKVWPFCRGKSEDVDYEVIDLEAYERWLHNCIWLSGGYKRGSSTVGHIPTVLFHSEDKAEQDKFLEDTLPRRSFSGGCLNEFRKRWVMQKSGSGEERGRPIVSVVIPSKDQPEVLEKCLQGCVLAGSIGYENSSGQWTSTEHLPMEILLVDNGSSKENRRRVERLAERFDEPNFAVRYLYQPMEFNFSRMCNLGAEAASGSFLLFLNDDVELCLPGCIEEMTALAARDFSGAVGLKLLYPGSTRIQHAGITNLPIGPVHKLQYLNDDDYYYYGANRGYRNVLAVTAACLMVARDRFVEAGGFAEELQVAFNDVDLCFRLYELGYRNVCMNNMYAFHHESLSRGNDEAPEKLSRLLEERDRLYARHPELEGVDPYYSIHLNREGLDTGIRPAWITAGNKAQQAGKILERFDPTNCRQDQCLMVRIEDCRKGEIIGFAVVLGDNNACYEKSLLMQHWNSSGLGENLLNQEDIDSDIYLIRLTGQYRPDLEENMPDQMNVALSGFWVKLAQGALPGGRYRLGLTARNRVTKLQLVNWSNRYFEVGECGPDEGTDR